MWEVERKIMANFTATVKETWPNIDNIPDDDNDITIPLLITAVSINFLFNIGNITYSCCKNKNKNLDDEEDSDNDDNSDIGDLDINSLLNGLEKTKKNKRKEKKRRNKRKKKNYYDQV
jgi:hypothetical protein